MLRKIKTKTGHVMLESSQLKLEYVKDAISLAEEIVWCSQGSEKTWRYFFLIENPPEDGPQGVHIKKMERGIVISFDFGEKTPYVSFDKSNYPPWPHFQSMAIVMSKEPGEKYMDISTDPAIDRYEHVFLTDRQAVDILGRIREEGWSCLRSCLFAPASYSTDETVETAKALEADGQIDLKGRYD